MAKRSDTGEDPFDDPLGLPSPYDAKDTPDDLWFLPDPELDPDVASEVHDIPLPKSETTSLVQPEAWTKAQGKHAARLAHAARAVGQLDMLVAQIGQGALERLALREVEALTWASGLRVSVEEIGRDQLQARASTDPRALQQARWAVRRLMGEGDTSDLRAFLGLHRSETAFARQDMGPNLQPDLRGRIAGEPFDEAAAEFLTHLALLPEAHEYTRAAFARHLWRLSELSPDDDRVEGAVWAAKLMAQGCVALRFVPLGQGARHLQGSGAEALGSFYSALEDGAMAARVDLQRLIAWRDHAKERVATIKGNNPARIVDVLIAKPLATTEMIEHGAGVSRDTAERLLVRMAGMGLVREVTGARRFRIWAAKV